MLQQCYCGVIDVFHHQLDLCLMILADYLSVASLKKDHSLKMLDLLRERENGIEYH